MATTLVTGGSGFIGSHLVRALAGRGDDLRLLARRKSSLDHLADLDFERITGDVTDRRAVRRAVEGSDRVFHVAGTTSMRPGSAEKVFTVNVGGTRIVMEEALAAGVERVVHTSSAGAVGPAKPGGTADEAQPFTAGRLGVAYINSKHEAEVEALRVAAHGLDLVIVNPTFVLGPDDPGRGTSNRLIRRVLLRQIPLFVDGGLNVVDVRDVAEGHLLAERKGKSGERYILGGRNFTLQRLFADVARISGVPPPPLKIPFGLTHGLGRDGRLGGDHASGQPGRADLRLAVVDLPLHEGEEGAGVQAAPARGDPGGGGALADGRARRPGRPRPAQRPRPARPSAASCRSAIG